jgi:hypothetical protein
VRPVPSAGRFEGTQRIAGRAFGSSAFRGRRSREKAPHAARRGRAAARSALRPSAQAAGSISRGIASSRVSGAREIACEASLMNARDLATRLSDLLRREHEEASPVLPPVQGRGARARRGADAGRAPPGANDDRSRPLRRCLDAAARRRGDEFVRIGAVRPERHGDRLASRPPRCQGARTARERPTCPPPRCAVRAAHRRPVPHAPHRSSGAEPAPVTAARHRQHRSKPAPAPGSSASAAGAAARRP